MIITVLSHWNGEDNLITFFWYIFLVFMINLNMPKQKKTHQQVWKYEWKMIGKHVPI